MKKILSFLSFSLFLVFIGSSLYVFGLPPFQKNTPLSPAAPLEKTTQETVLPSFLTEEKISRAKTYDEHMNRGKLLEENKYWDLALKEYQAAATLAPTKADPFVKSGRINLLNEKPALAEENFKNALKLEPQNIEAKIYLGRTYLSERKITEAKSIFDSISIENQSVKYYQGIIAAYFGDYEKSKQFLARTIEIGGNNDLSNKAQNYLNAYDEFNSNQGGQPTHLKTLLGRSFDQTGEYQMAIGILFNVIKEQKDYRDAWIILGHAYLNIQKFQDALESLNEAKKLDPENAETSFYLGLSYFGLNDLQQAATNLEQAKKLGYKQIIQINQKLAEIYLQLQQYDKSVLNYENVVSLNDDDINYYIRPLWLYLEKLHEPEKAYKLAQKALNNHPNEAMSYNLLAWTQIGLRKYPEAEANLQTALHRDPQLDAIYLNYGLLKELTGDNKEAITYYKKAHDMGKGNSVSNSAADRYNVLIQKIKNAETAETGVASVLAPQ